MNKILMKPIFTKYKYRLILEKSNQDHRLNWLFLPGGLGFGSEYFIPLIHSLNVPGNIWRLDFPEDGSNRFDLDNSEFDILWYPGLIDAIKTLDNVVLVTHSASAMLALTVPELDSVLKGLLIMSSAPSSKWCEGVLERTKDFNLPSVEKHNEIYQSNKSDLTFKQFFLAIVDYYVKPTSKNKLMNLLSNLPYHYIRYEWFNNHFHGGYQAMWVPSKTPTLIIGSSADFVTPISFFKDDTRFTRPNISIVDIPDAGHFPWIEQEELVKKHLLNFSSQIYDTTYIHV